MNDSDRYSRVVDWSEEDDCYIGRSPGLFLGGCHGSDLRTVLDELCQMIDEVVEDYRERGDPLPPATASRRWVGPVHEAA